jgi:hypothetical protein
VSAIRHSGGRVKEKESVMTSVDSGPQSGDPVATNPDFYRLLWENDDVRVLEYRDQPGQETTPHSHPNSILVALTDFQRRLSIGSHVRDVALNAGSAQWLPAQSHSGRNTGTTPTWTILVELKHSTQQELRNGAAGPTVPPDGVGEV